MDKLDIFIFILSVLAAFLLGATTVKVVPELSGACVHQCHR